MKLYLKALKLHFKTMLEYRSSLIFSFISQIAVFFSFYFVILSLFDKFNNIKGFTLYEVLLCFSVILCFIVISLSVIIKFKFAQSYQLAYNIPTW